MSAILTGGAIVGILGGSAAWWALIWKKKKENGDKK